LGGAPPRSARPTPGGSRQAGGGSTVAAGTPGEGKSLRYAVVGDSNSNGEAAGPDGGADPEGVAWPAQLARKLREDGVAVDLVANLAITGATIEQTTAEELPAFMALLTEVVETTGGPERVITVGTTAFYVTEQGKGYADGRDAEAEVKAFNTIVRDESEAAGVAFVDVFDLSEAMSDPSLVAPDGLHASARELGLWADRIAEVARERWADLQP
jgi:lysophospholipase L1-like esterase